MVSKESDHRIDLKDILDWYKANPDELEKIVKDHMPVYGKVFKEMVEEHEQISSIHYITYMDRSLYDPTRMVELTVWVRSQQGTEEA